MLDRPSKKAKSECEVCYLAHDDEIHEATLRIHRWLHWQVTRNFIDDSFDASEPPADNAVI